MNDIRNPLAPIVVGSGFLITVNAGNVLLGSTPTIVPSAVISLTPSATNFVQVLSSGLVGVNTSGFLSTSLPVAQIVCSSTAITSITDSRPDFYLSSGSSANTLFFGATSVPMSGIRIVPGLNAFNVASGTTDLYTVPAGKKALVTECTFTNPTGGGTSPVVFAQYKVSGVYTSWDFISNGATPGSLGNAALLAPMLLNAGETFAVNASATGLSLWPFVLEFDAAVPISVSRLSTFTVGDNTLLTAPANGVQIYPNTTGIGAGTPTKGTLFYFNNSGISRTIGWNVVPSGGSTSNANQIGSGISVSSPAINTRIYYGGMSINDFISINTDSNASGQSAYVIYRTL